MRAHNQLPPEEHQHLRYDETGRIQGGARFLAGPDGKKNAKVGVLYPNENFHYDEAGNLLHEDWAHAGGYVKNNRILLYEDKQFAWDGFGRLKEKKTGNHTVQRFEYDSEHRLIKVAIESSPNGHSIVEFEYDPLGRRTAKSSRKIEKINGQTTLGEEKRTQFVWDGMRLLWDEDNFWQGLYIYADGYEPLAKVETDLRARLAARLRGERPPEITSLPGRILYYNNDVNGAPEEMTDAQGQEVWSITYRAWGNALKETYGQREETKQNIRFQGQYLDRETGLHYNTFRYYDPDVGRFTTEDPIGIRGGLNLYQYADNPIAWIDPWGWCSVKKGQTIIPGSKVRRIRPGTNGKTIIIGRNMKDRVIPSGKKIGAEHWEGFDSSLSKDANLANNRKWIEGKIAEGYSVVDIGLDPAFASQGKMAKGPYYRMETEVAFGTKR